MKMALARAMLVAGLILILGCLPNTPRTPGRCTILARPRTVACANGRVYIIHDTYWQDIGPSTPLPVVPKE